MTPFRHTSMLHGRATVQRLPRRSLRPLRLLLLLSLLMPLLMVHGCAAARQGADAALQQDAAADAPRWWKGNLHTHSLWSDGDDFPEMIAAWYRDNGYSFVAFTEHDMLQAGEFWVDVAAEDDGWPPRRESARLALPGYRARFGNVLEERHEGERHLVRLRGLDEYRGEFEEPARFLLLMGEEITDREGAHINAFNLVEAITPRGGSGPADRIRRNFEAISAARDADGRPVTAVVNHPNYLWALTAEELAGIEAVRHFELYNGHLHVNNAGEPPRAGTERMWDVMLAHRYTTGGAPIYGVATDDAHGYRAFSDSTARQGRAWVMVRADRLEPRPLLDAIDAGDFYASTGVTLGDVRRDGATLRIEIEPEPGATYRTQFIGTRRGVSLDSTPVHGADGQALRTTRAYHGDIGVVLAEADGPAAAYTFRGDELYVRAKVLSSAARTDAGTGRVLGPATAWTQPFRP